MSASLVRLVIRRSEISLPRDVSVMSQWRWNSSWCRLQTMRTVVPLASKLCPTTCTIHPNLLDVDDVANSAHVSPGTQKTVFCCSIVSAILASCALPIIDGMLWMSGGSDHLSLHEYHVCVSVHTLELRSVGKGVQRVWLSVLVTSWPRTWRTGHPRDSWSTCETIVADPLLCPTFCKLAPVPIPLFCHFERAPNMFLYAHHILERYQRGVALIFSCN